MLRFQEFVQDFIEERDQPKKSNNRYPTKNSKKPFDKYAKDERKPSKHTRFADNQPNQKHKGHHRGYKAEEDSEQEGFGDESDSDFYDDGFVSVDKTVTKGALS